MKTVLTGLVTLFVIALSAGASAFPDRPDDFMEIAEKVKAVGTARGASTMTSSVSDVAGRIVSRSAFTVATSEPDGIGLRSLSRMK